MYDLAEPINVAELALQVRASVGIAIYASETSDGALTEQDGNPVETVMRQADMAMYRAKTGRRGAYHFFEQGMDEELQQRIQARARDQVGDRDRPDHSLLPVID